MAWGTSTLQGSTSGQGAGSGLRYAHGGGVDSHPGAVSYPLPFLAADGVHWVVSPEAAHLACPLLLPSWPASLHT